MLNHPRPGQTVKERPIIFSADMVRALLAGRKTQTRRVMKPQPRVGLRGNGDVIGYCDGQISGPEYHVWEPKKGDGGGAIPMHEDAMYRVERCCPYGVVGDRLWVREAWAVNKYYDGRPANGCGPVPEVAVECRCEPDAVTVLPGRQHRSLGKPGEIDERGRWRSPIFMPRWASRITLEITGVRLERVQDISEADAKAEGCDGKCPVGNVAAYLPYPCSYHYSQLWESINGPGSWDANPFVWVLEFKRIETHAGLIVPAGHINKADHTPQEKQLGNTL